MAKHASSVEVNRSVKEEKVIKVHWGDEDTEGSGSEAEAILKVQEQQEKKKS